MGRWVRRVWPDVGVQKHVGACVQGLQPPPPVQDPWSSHMHSSPNYLLLSTHYELNRALSCSRLLPALVSRAGDQAQGLG